ncbi:Swt1 family HEPN domain-containing protein [Sphingomonas sp. SUN039]|uniref:Swt1 family HEPN domain-containing protein n=1 Tax=Sphingomonas sp. SUN039 TaxID=2937787 RepID=UPI0021646C3E|nr:Swt1 family HEPN domain-containing protein [Sphingomonas sp. SUN039]UVO55439.1 Swt1 family HEPN domain-containing protein [Sphingomonas sp. SUN039]
MTDELQGIERRFAIELGHVRPQPSEAADYYQQFDQAIRSQAAGMAAHYELFYCLEQSMRELIISTLSEKSAGNWWIETVPTKIVDDVRGRQERERDSGFSQRSDREIDYTNFGELSVIITSNWDVFGAIFTSKRAVERIISSLNLLRGPIAHCSPLADDEVDRLELTVKDWFRAMS